MIIIHAERCNGCGVCVAACAEGALYLVDGQAMVDVALCRDCRACIAACPTEAIVYTSRPSASRAEPARVPALRPEVEAIQVRMREEPLPLRARVLPVVGAALVWTGREIVPRLADYFLDALDRRAVERQAAGTGSKRAANGSAAGGGGGGRQHRRRRRGR